MIYLSDSELSISYGEEMVNKKYLFNGNIGNKFIFNIKDSVYIDIDVNSIATKLPAIEFAGTKQSVDILFDQHIKKYRNKYTIKVHGDISFVTTTPQYLIGILDSNSINFSPKWSYLYISEKGKEFYQSNPYESFNIVDSNANLLDNIVIAVGEDDLLTIPDEWNENRNFYLLQENTLYIEGSTNISCLQKFLLLDNKFNFFMGNVTLYVPNNFSFYSFNWYKYRFDLLMILIVN